MTEAQDISSTTQKFLDIFDITNDAVVLRDGTISVVLLISAMNFGLLAEPEQDAIMYAYAALLNSLNFPIQIVINSKTKDATSYLQLLDAQAQKATSQNKRDLIQRYQNFVGQLIRERNVLDKKFYVVIPALPIEVGMITAQNVLPGNQVPEITQEQKAAIVEKGLGILEPRRDHLIAQFNRIGLYARQLATQEIIEIFYNNYNPEAYEGQQLTDSREYASAVVSATTVAPASQMPDTPQEPSNLQPPVAPDSVTPQVPQPSELSAPQLTPPVAPTSTEPPAPTPTPAPVPAPAPQPIQPDTPVEISTPALVATTEPTPSLSKAGATLPPIAEL